MSCNILALGEVLWDLLPAGKQLGGAPANFAFHCRSLGARAGLVTRVGNDELGREIVERFQLLGLPIETVQLDPERPTGTVGVTLAVDGQPHFTIHERVAWDHIEADGAALAAARITDAVCFGSLAQRGEASRTSIRALVAAAPPHALRVFDVNLRPPFVDRDVIADSLELASVLKLNDQELPELCVLLDLPTGERRAMEALATRYRLSLVALTRGSAGSLLLAHGRWADHPGKLVTVSDTIGAGDAFTAALTVGLLTGRSLEGINRHANDVAAFVCSQPGGMPTLPEALRRPASESTDDCAP